jgi:hypothetical protein
MKKLIILIISCVLLVGCNTQTKENAMSVNDQIKTTLVPSKSIGLTEEPTIKPTVKPTVKPTENYYKYYDAERYTTLMDKNIIEYLNKPVEEIIEHMAKNFDDKLVLVKSDIIKSPKNDYYINRYKCKDGSILILTLERNRCITYDWEK